MDSVIANRYELVRQIGSGGMGEVHEALDRETHRKVAIKLLRLGPNAGDVSARFRREILAMAQVSSKHVIAIHDAGEEAGEPYLVMEYLDGEDLGAIADRLHVLTVDAAVRVVAQVCDGLIAVHAAGIVHRDIKPSNVMLLAPTASGSRILKILDFGIARVRATTELTEMTQTGAIIGSPLYMAPEQLRGMKTIDERADIWALGVLLYRLLCGRVPHARESVADQLITVCSEPAPPLRTRAPWVTPELATFVHRALAIDVGARIPTARAFAEGLRRWLRDGSTITDEMLVGRAPTEEHPAGTPVSQTLASTPIILSSEPASRGPRRVFLLALLLAVVLTATALVLRANKPRHLARADAGVPVAEDEQADAAVGEPPLLVGKVAENLTHTEGAAWFATMRTHCTSLELHSLLADSPPPKTPDGTAFATACAALAGDMQVARTLLYALDPSDRPYGAGAMFQLAHEMAHRSNNEPKVAEIMRLVLEVWPQNYQAAYAAALVEVQQGDKRGANHLHDFLRLHRVDDAFSHTARQLLDVLAEPDHGCGHPLVDPLGHAIIPKCGP